MFLPSFLLSYLVFWYFLYFYQVRGGQFHRPGQFQIGFPVRISMGQFQIDIYLSETVPD